MSLELIFGKPHLAEGDIAIAQKAKHSKQGLFSRLLGLFSSMIGVWRKVFVRRELFIRNASGTKRIVFEKGMQIQLALVGLGLVFWLAYSTSGVLLGKSSNKIMQERLAETHNAYETKISNLQKEYEELNLRIFLTEKEFSKISDELIKRHNHLTNLIGMQKHIGKKVKRRNRIEKKIKAKENKSRKQGSMKPLRSHDDVILSSRPAGPSYQHFPAIKLPFHQDANVNKIMTGNKPIDKIVRQVVALDREQRAILDHIEETIAVRLKGYHRAFAQTEAVKADLFAERVARERVARARQNTNKFNQFSGSIPEQENAPIGGPFVTIAAPRTQATRTRATDKTDKAGTLPLLLTVPQTGNNPYKISMQAREQINQLHAHIQSLTNLDRAIIYLPLAQPMPVYYITSPFGPRIDPFTREWAFHTGVDIAGKNDRVQATLPGKVAFAGVARGYGKMVEIDHGFGVKTRYGHLKKISVHKGQKVKFKQRVGLMGNTGRSTGEHLHYEILFNDKPYDPWKFIEAGKNVFEASQ